MLMTHRPSPSTPTEGNERIDHPVPSTPPPAYERNEGLILDRPCLLMQSNQRLCSPQSIKALIIWSETCGKRIYPLTRTVFVS
jgi:hypothetical protein